VSGIGDGKRLFAAVLQQDMENIVAKRLADPYRSTATWWKTKNAADRSE
jgi:ATP-dependent DNA ligase